MMPAFSADEVFEMAEQIERNGVKFYKTAASYASTDQAKALFERLAEMEQQHEKTFAQMRSQLSGQAGKRTTFDPEGEAALYLRAFVDGKVFDPGADPSSRLSGEEPAGDVLRTAIGLEKDSIVFYLGIKNMVPAALGAEQIDKIIQEEMSHVRILGDELAALG